MALVLAAAAVYMGDRWMDYIEVIWIKKNEISLNCHLSNLQANNQPTAESLVVLSSLTAVVFLGLISHFFWNLGAWWYEDCLESCWWTNNAEKKKQYFY